MSQNIARWLRNWIASRGPKVEPRSSEEADDTAQALDFVQRLYREIRALRVDEGTSEIQKEIISHQLLKAADG